MKLDADRGGVVRRLVILVQSSADFAGLNPDYGVVSRCVSHGTLKQVHPDHALLEPLVVLSQAVVDHVREELLTPLARLKNRTIQD
jgi:hypothetical protein